MQNILISSKPHIEETKGEINLAEIVKATNYFDVEAWAKETASDKHYFDEQAADRAVQFFPRYLCHTKGKLWAGKPFILEPWEVAIVRTIFGWKRKKDGMRRFRIVYIEVGRKNGKTQLAAGIALYLAFCDQEPGAEVYSVANDKKQAGICFNEAAKMRKASHVLVSRTLASKHAIYNSKYGQKYEYLSSEDGTKDGLNASGIIYDEFHAFKDRGLFDVMHTSTGMREQPLELIITTAGKDKMSICWEQHWHAEQVRDRIIEDDEFLPIIYAANDNDDYKDPKVWAKANPNLGVSLKIDYMEKQVEKCKTQPSYVGTFKRLHLNIWSESVERWLDIEKWNLGGPDRNTHPEELKVQLVELEESLIARPCFGGLDLARVSDLSSYVLLFPPIEKDELWKAIVRYWCPEENILKRTKKDRVPYDVWREYGFITATPGETTDFEFIEKEIVDLAGLYDLQELAYDQTFAGELVNSLMKQNIPLVKCSQTHLALGSATSELERMVIAGDKFYHGGHPILRWNAGNTVVIKNSYGEIKPDKAKAPERIDGTVALIMALARATAGGYVKPVDLGALIESGQAII